MSFAVLQDDQRPPRGELIARFPHTGFESDRLLV
ncbi:hypothetical protein GGE12_005102 [Rhizobium mongolense]|uniref:Uncharacterized protein n=1 Tax=Rhizobium mongolense TaxID=57676 RepID=A0A7W6RRG0_9HYPH|nr:hypothetical protein [Rhizobium mongolense]